MQTPPRKLLFRKRKARRNDAVSKSPIPKCRINPVSGFGSSLNCQTKNCRRSSSASSFIIHRRPFAEKLLAGTSTAFICSHALATMSFSKIVFSSLRNRLAAPPTNHLGRFGKSNRFHSSSYRRFEKRENVTRLLPEETPSSQSWSIYTVPAALLGGIGTVVAFLHYNDERRAVLKGQGVNFDRSIIKGPIIGGPFTLIDTEGKIVTERNLLGNWVLLYFGYTSSPDVGPAEIQKMAKAVDILESKENVKILPVFVTIDPQRDPPAHLGAYLKEFNSRILGLTGSVAAVRQMAQEYRIFFKKVEEEGDDYLVDSSHNMYLINPNMEVVRCYGVEYKAEDLSEAILKELQKS